MMSDADRPEAPFTSRSPCGRRTCAFHGTLERFDDRSVPSSWSRSRRTSANLQTEKLPRQANDESLTGALKEAISKFTVQTVPLMNQRNDIDILRRRMDACVLLVKSVGGGRDGTELPTP